AREVLRRLADKHSAGPGVGPSQGLHENLVSLLRRWLRGDHADHQLAPGGESLAQACDRAGIGTRLTHATVDRVVEPRGHPSTGSKSFGDRVACRDNGTQRE